MPIHILIYPVTLFSLAIYEDLLSSNTLPNGEKEFWYLEDPVYFTKYKMNKKKLVLHRASMKKHESMVKKKYKTNYIDHSKVKAVYRRLKKKDLWVIDPNDHDVMTSLKKLTINIIPSPGFILSTEEAVAYGERREKFINAHFYKMMRQKTQYLMKAGKPVGGKWSFDSKNRKKIPKGLTIPSLPPINEDRELKEAMVYVEENFSKHYGSVDGMIYPTTKEEVTVWLDDFIKKRAKNFGPYQDYIMEDHLYLFHSVLSSSINIGLILPSEVCEKMLKAYQKKEVSLASCEGFIRQIISWREYVRMIYLVKGKTSPNFFKQRRKIGHRFYTGETGIEILDVEIMKAVDSAYSHHIVRLMVFGNIFTLLRISPKDMHRWFMEIFIDSYQWVMWANVYGMGSYADGGMSMTRPYISSANYLKNMSDYKRGPWEDDVTSLYYSFLKDHMEELRKIYATSSQVALYKKFSKKKKDDIKKNTKRVMSSVFR